MARITISRVFTRNVTKFFLVFSFGALVCLLIVKSVYVDPSRRLSESQMIDKALVGRVFFTLGGRESTTVNFRTFCF